MHPLSNIFENASVHQGGLDQWTLGHLPVHERMMEGEQTLGMPKASHALIHSGINRDGNGSLQALPENALTLEELESRP